MSRTPSPPLPLVMPQTIPGRVIVRVQNYCFPDGTVREKRWVSETIQAPDGVIHTREVTEVVPPLACGCVPENMHDVTQCAACRAVVCVSQHAFACAACGQSHCLRCRSRVTVEDQTLDLCPGCALEATTPAIIRKLRHWIWGS